MNIGKGAEKKRFFKHAWLDEDIFRGWLAPHLTDNKAVCTLCNIVIRCSKADLI